MTVAGHALQAVLDKVAALEKQASDTTAEKQRLLDESQLTRDRLERANMLTKKVGALAKHKDMIMLGAMAAAADAGEGVAVDLLGVVAGEKRGARRPAAGGVVELGEANAILSKPIKIGRGDLAAVGAKVGVAEVVGEDEHHIRSRWGGEGRQRGEQ